MLIGIISDTHDDVEALRRGVETLIYIGAEILIHCGDWVSMNMVNEFDRLAERYDKRAFAVLGNNDKEIKELSEKRVRLAKEVLFPDNNILTISIDKKRIAVYHGENKTVLKKLYQSQFYDVIFCGHSHIPKKENGGRTLLLNPGSASQKIANSKHIPCSVALYNSISGEADLVYLT